MQDDDNTDSVGTSDTFYAYSALVVAGLAVLIFSTMTVLERLSVSIP